MSIWGTINGTVSGTGLGVAFYKIPGALGWNCLDACSQPGHCPAQAITRLSQLSKEWKKDLHSGLRGKSRRGSRKEASSPPGPLGPFHLL